MHAWLLFLCRITVAVSIGCFSTGWALSAEIKAAALEQPLTPTGSYVHPLPVKHGPVRYITADQQMMLAILRPTMMASWIVALIAFVVIGARDAARPDIEHEPALT